MDEIGKKKKKKENLHSLVWAVDVVNRQDSQVAVISEVAKCHPGTRLDVDFIEGLLRNVQSDGHGEDVAVRQAAILDDSKKEKSQLSQLTADHDNFHIQRTGRSPFGS